MDADFTTTTSPAPDRLIAGEYPRVDEAAILLSGNHVRGTVLGKVTASGKWIQSLSASADGSQTPRAILAVDTDASGGEVETTIYRTGEYSEDEIVLGTGHTVDSVREGLAGLGIFLKPTVGA